MEMTESQYKDFLHKKKMFEQQYLLGLQGILDHWCDLAETIGFSSLEFLEKFKERQKERLKQQHDMLKELKG